MQERRMFERFEVDFPVRFSCIDTKHQGEGKMVNISAGGGGMIVTSERLLPPMRLELWLLIPDNNDPLQISGQVVWSTESKMKLFKVGIQFEKIDFMAISRVLRAQRKITLDNENTITPRGDEDGSQ